MPAQNPLMTTTDHDQRLALFLEMLRYMRPAGSKAERRFINRFIKPLGVEQDAYGNLYKRIGSAPVLWSCHTDTVHRHGGIQTVEIDSLGFISTPDGDCLGADCTSGVFLMNEMVKLGVQGLYIWHREEEIGRLGSQWIAKHTPELLEGIQFAIAFDRKGRSSVVTHQLCDRTCSDEFANSLAAFLGGTYAPDEGGVYTDTASYPHIIGECTNISVGYFGAHTASEEQDWGFLSTLLDRLLAFDHNRVIAKREPGEAEVLTWDKWSDSFDKFWTEGKTDTNTKRTHLGPSSDPYDPRSSSQRSFERLMETVLDHPDVVASILDEYGITADDILSYNLQMTA